MVLVDEAEVPWINVTAARSPPLRRGLFISVVHFRYLSTAMRRSAV